MTISATELSTISVLSGLERSALSEIAPLFVVRQIKAKQAVFESEDVSDDVYFIQSGKFIARSFGADGREVCFGTFEKGDCFSDMGKIEAGMQQVHIEAAMESTVLKMTAENFSSVAKRYPHIMAAMLGFHVELIHCLAARVFEFSTMTVPERVRLHLVRLAEQSVGDGSQNSVLIDPAPSHYEIAVAISTHREAVSRELGLLTASGVIETGRRSIRILDMERLHGIIEARSGTIASN